ncbi:MAG: sulfotransferase [Acidimicrobiia bacterium]
MRALRRLVSPTYLRVDPVRDPARSVLLLGSPRSGTTKLAEVLASARTTRLVFEPMQPRSPYRPRRFVAGRYRPPDAEDPELLAAWQRILAGRVRGSWVDARNRSRISTHRVVKCVAANNLASWLRHHFPATPIVYVYRHPVAVARSLATLRRTRAEWALGGVEGAEWVLRRSGLLDGPLADRADDVRRLVGSLTTDFEGDVVRWCLHNACPLTQPPGSGFLTVRHEDFLDDPEAMIDRMGRFTGLDVRRGRREADRPSSTDWTRSAADGGVTRTDRREGWRQRVDPRDQATAMEIVRVFGLEQYVDP